MKKLTFAFVLVVVACLGFGASATLETPPAAPNATTAAITPEAAPVCASAEALPFGAVDFTFTPNYCGDPCSDEGAQVGCINQNVDPWRRALCTCWNGYLTC